MGIESQPRTYEPIRISFRPASVVSQTDRWTRQLVPRDRQTETHIILGAELELRGLKQGFEALGKIVQKGFDEKRLEAKVKAALVVGLPKRVVIDLFKLTELTVEPGSAELDEWEADSNLDDIHITRLEEQAKAGNAATNAWRAAIDEACEGLRAGYEYHRDKIRDAIAFIELCNRSANNGMMSMWCEEKMARIRSDLGKLATYKNVRHPNAIRTAGDIAGLLRSWPVVNSWHEHPPRRWQPTDAK